ncbi:mycA [Symbiodinium pilosum]|uniref:MycA protein n=1 Tax=Symbiodinium pilosum TaxID=2952 RepID=A0A812X830_SYMPI|nr:mycA [Symbiodinium pilosum]
MGQFGMEAHVGFFLKFMGILFFVMTFGQIGQMAYCWLMTGGLLYVVLKSGLGFDNDDTVAILAAVAGLRAIPFLYKRLLTLVATYPLSLTFKFASKILPKYTIDEDLFFSCDGASPEVAERRRASMKELSEKWKKKYPKCQEFSSELKKMISDLRFTSARCFPAFNGVMQKYLDPSMALDRTEGVDVVDLDQNSSMDISGSYGVNVCGYEKYKDFIEAGWANAKKQGLFLGSLDNVVLDNIARLRKISGQDEVSFHMSGTEAVMCAVRVARFNTKKPLVVTFGGAYHGWWDGMQPVAGNERLPQDVLCLKDMNNLSLKVIELRGSEIAAVLVNPLQCFHLNQSPPGDAVLSTNNRKVGPTPGYKEWLHKLKETCTRAGVCLIFDEVYTGFRLHPRGAQGAYDVKADIVCYGKTLGGGLPIGVVCGPKDLMARGDAKKAARINYVIGTFAGHPFVMACMNAFLKWLDEPATVKSYDEMHANIDAFIKAANKKFEEKGYPVQLTNWFSVWSILYTKPGRYHWIFQYFLKDAGVNLSWVGTGRLLFSLEWKKASESPHVSTPGAVVSDTVQVYWANQNNGYKQGAIATGFANPEESPAGAARSSFVAAELKALVCLEFKNKSHKQSVALGRGLFENEFWA